jgi:hypothetical protein
LELDIDDMGKQSATLRMRAKERAAEKQVYRVCRQSTPATYTRTNLQSSSHPIPIYTVSTPYHTDHHQSLTCIHSPSDILAS